MAKHSSLSWTDAIGLYETHLRARRASDRTIAIYVPDLLHLANAFSEKRPDEVSVADLRELQCGLMSGAKARSRRPLSAATVCRITAAWRSFYRFLADEDRIAKDPGVRLESPRVPKRAPLGVLSVKETERLLDAPDISTPIGLRDRAALELLYSAGLRNAEACALDLTDVDHQEREVVVRAGKGEKGRIVPLTRSAYGRLRDYIERARPVLEARHRQPSQALLLTPRGRAHSGTLTGLIARAQVLARIKRHVTPHTLRRTFATTLLKNGVNIRSIQTLLGHDSLATTAFYLRIDRSELRRELLLRHPRERMEA